MKVVVNKCFGGFSLSPLAVQRMAELQGKECHFFTGGLSEPYKRVTVEEATESPYFWSAFTVKDPSAVLPKKEYGADGSYKDFNAAYEGISIDSRPDDRSNPILVKVVEELGEKANGECAKLEVVEIPDDVKYRIDEYDGLETIAEGAHGNPTPSYE